jgi:hypothetical protein
MIRRIYKMVSRTLVYSLVKEVETAMATMGGITSGAPNPST